MIATSGKRVRSTGSNGKKQPLRLYLDQNCYIFYYILLYICNVDGNLFQEIIRVIGIKMCFGACWFFPFLEVFLSLGWDNLLCLDFGDFKRSGITIYIFMDLGCLLKIAFRMMEINYMFNFILVVYMLLYDTTVK
eukprot:TRINITY_DN7769_c0_g1_i1.p2 TRINITY_DN7769_c0_g1~~TRINITY_DN7769_c0_g1_i1.p2  ORF type:complete len:135 (-),score=4.11 TRINITY_DN7769_c0_g1_i1:83-487(-)